MAIFVIVVIIFAVIWIVVSSHNSSPEAQRKREESLARSLGQDTDSLEWKMQKMQAETARLNDHIQKKEQNKETAQIVKGAVVGGVIAGDVGAVVGAVSAKNKVENERASGKKSMDAQAMEEILHAQSLLQKGIEEAQRAKAAPQKEAPYQDFYSEASPELKELAHSFHCLMKPDMKFTASDLARMTDPDMAPRTIRDAMKVLMAEEYVEMEQTKGKQIYTCLYEYADSSVPKSMAGTPRTILNYMKQDEKYTVTDLMEGLDLSSFEVLPAMKVLMDHHKVEYAVEDRRTEDSICSNLKFVFMRKQSSAS